ncbi:dihydroxy-acid dehydratase, partial [bacterium]|nr:dihydroxy-acid dehydratase [bacterium]
MNPKQVKNLPAARACLYGTGIDKEQIDKPCVAIVYAQNEICPGHVHLDRLALSVQRGIAEAGGTGIKMNIGVG